MTDLDRNEADDRNQDFAGKHPVLGFILDLCCWICIWDLI